MVTTTFCGPTTLDAPVSQTMVDAVSTCTLLQATAMVTTAWEAPARWNPVPVRVTVALPATGPEVGVIATIAHVMVEPTSRLPLVGASGAISGVMGAYFILFPGVKIRTLFLIIVFPLFTKIRAWIFLMAWIGLQYLSAREFVDDGVAYWAHIGGFVVGLATAKVFQSKKIRNGKVV